MCEVSTAVMLGVALAGAGIQAKGQHDAASAAKNKIKKALRSEEALRKKALGQSEDVVNQQGADALAAESQKPQQVVAQEGAAGDSIAKAFADSAGVGASDQGRITGAATGAKRTATNEATRTGFSRALQAQLARLGNLTSNNLLIGEDSRRIQAALPGQLAAAGQKGADMRLIGQLAMTGAQGAYSNQAWQPRPGTSNAGLTGAV